MKISTSLTENYEYALVTSQNMDDADWDRNISSSERETLQTLNWHCELSYK